MIILKTFAKSEKEALELSCKYLGAKENEIEIVVHRKGSSGFLGFGPKKPGLYHILAKPGVTPLSVVTKGVLSTIVHDMGFRVKFQKMEKLADGKFYVELSSQQAGSLIGKSGRTLEALQFIVNLIVEKITGSPPKIILDVENYRARRARHLQELAKRVAESVVRTGKSKLLDPLNPYERRLIHLALQEDERVTTISEGEGVYKRVRILLKEEAPVGEGGKPVSEEISEEDLEANFDVENDEIEEGGEFTGFPEEANQNPEER